jgi:hypothetical protein
MSAFTGTLQSVRIPTNSDEYLHILVQERDEPHVIKPPEHTYGAWMIAGGQPFGTFAEFYKWLRIGSDGHVPANDIRVKVRYSDHSPDVAISAEFSYVYP